MQPVLGKLIQRPGILDKKLVRELKALAHADDPYDTITGKTLCTSDFYEGNSVINSKFADQSPVDRWRE